MVVIQSRELKSHTAFDCKYRLYMYIAFDIYSKLFLSKTSSNINSKLLTEFLTIGTSCFTANIDRSWDCL